MRKIYTVILSKSLGCFNKLLRFRVHSRGIYKPAAHPKCALGHCILYQLPHFFNLFFSGLARIKSHNIQPYCPLPYKSPNISSQLELFQGIQIITKGLPIIIRICTRFYKSRVFIQHFCFFSFYRRRTKATWTYHLSSYTLLQFGDHN